MEASAFEREFQKNKLYSKMKAMKESSRLPKKQRTFLEKIDYEAKTFVRGESVIYTALSISKKLKQKYSVRVLQFVTGSA